jgi:hypothetical protein
MLELDPVNDRRNLDDDLLKDRLFLVCLRISAVPTT